MLQTTTAVMLLQGGGNAGLRAWGVAQVASFAKSKQASAQPLHLIIKPKHLQLVIWPRQSCLREHLLGQECQGANGMCQHHTALHLLGPMPGSDKAVAVSTPEDLWACGIF